MSRPTPAVHGLRTQCRPVTGLRAIETKTNLSTRLGRLTVNHRAIVKRLRHIRTQTLHDLTTVETSGLRRITGHKLGRGRFDLIERHPRRTGIDEFENLPPILRIREIQ